MRRHAGRPPNRWSARTVRRFPAHTRIQTTRTATSALRVGDVVLAFDARVDRCRGALVPRRVTRLYRNTTTEWICLRWFDSTAREVITTPGHHFLDASGGFPTIEDMTRTGSATVVLASGALAQVTAERTPFCADVAPLFERAMGHGLGVGNEAVKVGGVMGRGRRGRRTRAGSVHMRTVWKLTESQGPVNFRSSNVEGIVLWPIREGRRAVPQKTCDHGYFGLSDGPPGRTPPSLPMSSSSTKELRWERT